MALTITISTTNIIHDGNTTVYKEVLLDRLVAVKVYEEMTESDDIAMNINEGVEEALQRAEAAETEDEQKLAKLQTLNHENVARFFGVFTAIVDNRTFPSSLAMELALGGSLQRALKNHAIYKKEQARSIVHQIAAGLEYLHSRGHVHGNLKPSNVLFKDEAQTRLMIADYSLPTKYQSEVGIPILFRIKDEPITKSSGVYSMAAIARSVYNNEFPRRLPTVEQLDTEGDIVWLMFQSPERYKMIFQGLFRPAEDRPSATEFRLAFEEF